MDYYDAFQPPPKDQWLALDEQERLMLVEEYHLDQEGDPDQLGLHAVFHVIVENRVAMGEQAAELRIAGLMANGMDRHEAVHELAAEVAKEIFRLFESDDAGAGSLAEIANSSATAVRERRVGRNDPCPCGSGKKFKKCCLGT